MRKNVIINDGAEHVLESSTISALLTNFLDPSVYQFTGPRRTKPITEVVIHETVTRSAKVAVSVLKKRKLGVHFIVDENAKIQQHGDLVTKLNHAKGHNQTSIGIELVNPYYPKYLRDGLVWHETIGEIPWAHEKKYVLPTRNQLESLHRLVCFLVDVQLVPSIWSGEKDGRMAMSRVAGLERATPGIHAHTYFGHADGAFPVLYCWLRSEALLDSRNSYSTAIELALNGRRTVKVGDLIAAEPTVSDAEISAIVEETLAIVQNIKDIMTEWSNSTDETFKAMSKKIESLEFFVGHLEKGGK